MKKLHKFLLGVIIFLNLVTAVGIASVEGADLDMKGFRISNGPSVRHHKPGYYCRHAGKQKVKPARFKKPKPNPARLINLHNRRALMVKRNDNQNSGKSKQLATEDTEKEYCSPKFR